jgi:hypothetical protein
MRWIEKLASFAYAAMSGVAMTNMANFQIARACKHSHTEYFHVMLVRKRSFGL